MDDNIKELLKSLGGSKSDSRDSRESKFSPDIELQMLTEEAKKYLEAFKPEVGDILQWKSKALVSTRIPSKDGYLVVTEVLDEPIRNMDNKLHGSTYFGELSDIRGMLVDSEGSCICYLYDSNKFKKIGNIYAGIKKGKGGIRPVK